MVSEIAQKNIKKTYLIILLTNIIFMILLFLLLNGFKLGYISIIVAICLPIIITLIRYLSSNKIILSLNKARLLNEDETSYLSDTLENLCKIYDLPIPRLYIIEAEQPNVFSLGLNPKKASICFTTGLFNVLDEQELECILARELAEIKNYDTFLANIVTVMVGINVIWADKFSRYLLKRKEKGKEKVGTFISLYNLFLVITTPISAKLMELLLSKETKLIADKKAAEITNNPNSLITALEKLEIDETPLETLNISTSHMFIVNPIKPINGKDALNMLSAYPNMENRIKALENL